ncbi:MAG: TolC family protein [Candidatus Latescibacterota bacterium]|nr:MAG: TolC family protein [Candidatus Latescibacterota bacterium]
MKNTVVLFGILFCLVVSASDSFPQARVLSLEESLDIAIGASTTVGIYRERLQTSRQDVLANHGRFLPNFNMSFYAGHTFIGPTSSIFTDAQGRQILQTGFDYENYNFQINSQMTLFDWGASFKYLNSAKRGSEAAEFDLQYQKDIVTAQVIRAYYDVVRKKNLKDVQEEAVEAAERNLDQVEAFFRIGSNTKADVLQAKVRLGNTQLALITAKNSEELAKATLASLLNLPMGEDFDVDPSLEITKVDPNLDDEVEYMLSHRSDLLASRKRVAAAKDSQTAEENNRWPSIGGGLTYSWSDRAYPDNSNFFRNEYSWGLGVQLSWNIFDRFQTKSNIQRAKAQRRIAEQELKQAKLDAILEVRQLYTILREAEERIRVTEETVAQATENVRLAAERYRVGAGTQLETIESAATLQEAQGNLVEAKCDYLIAKADLLRAAGRPVKAD